MGLGKVLGFTCSQGLTSMVALNSCFCVGPLGAPNFAGTGLGIVSDCHFSDLFVSGLTA